MASYGDDEQRRSAPATTSKIVQVIPARCLSPVSGTSFFFARNKMLQIQNYLWRLQNYYLLFTHLCSRCPHIA